MTVIVGACLLGMLTGLGILVNVIRRPQPKDASGRSVFVGNFASKPTEILAQFGAFCLFALGAGLVVIWSVFYKHLPIYLIAAADMAVFAAIFLVRLFRCLTSSYQPSSR
jgi:hypothetical protein